jgi:hypothetical protein
MRISGIVDAHFRLIVDGKTGVAVAARGGHAGTGWTVAESSTISLKPSAVGRLSGVVLGPVLLSVLQAPARPPEAPPWAVSRMDLVALSSILWPACTMRSRMASASVGSLR